MKTSKVTKKLDKKTTGLTNEGKRLDALTRINNLETAFIQLSQALNNSFSQIKQDLTELDDKLSKYDMFVMGMVEVLDKELLRVCNKASLPAVALLDTITAKVKENRIKQLEAEVEQQDAQLKIEVAEGRLKVAEAVVNDTDLVVSSQTNKDGQTLSPSKTFLVLEQFKPGVKELLVGKKAGESVTLPEGGTVNVIAVYNVVPQQDSTTSEPV